MITPEEEEDINENSTLDNVDVAWNKYLFLVWRVAHDFHVIHRRPTDGNNLVAAQQQEVEEDHAISVSREEIYSDRLCYSVCFLFILPDDFLQSRHWPSDFNSQPTPTCRHCSVRRKTGKRRKMGRSQIVFETVGLEIRRSTRDTINQHLFLGQLSDVLLVADRDDGDQGKASGGPVTDRQEEE